TVAQQLSADLADRHAVALEEIPTADMQASIAAVLAEAGWGRVDFDFTHHDRGVIEVTLTDPPVAANLSSGLIAGLLSELSSVDLDCVETGDGASQPDRFVVSLQERIDRIRMATRDGRSQHSDAVELLIQKQV